LKKFELTRDDVIDLMVYFAGCAVIGGICFYAGIKYRTTEKQEQQPVEVIEQSPQPQPYINGYIRDPRSKVR